MSYQSNYGYIIRIPDSSFEAYRGVDTLRAYLLRNNIQHIVDESPQVRVNFMSSGNGDSFAGALNSADGTRIWHATFPQTWTRQDRPTNLEVRVATQANNAGLDFRARVVPASYSIGDLSAPALFDETASSSGSGAEWLIELFTDFDANGIPAGLADSVWADYLINEGDIAQVRIAEMRLEVTVPAGNGDAANQVVGVSVREFC
jgi:hypothetical protein